MSDEPRLLVVDDEQVICQACRRVFSRQGFRVEESTDPEQGLQQARSNDYAAILLDIKMPKMDGIQFLEALREQKPDVPVMIMTGYPSIPNATLAMRLGASDYVTKPFTPEEITQAVQRLLTRHEVDGESAMDGSTQAEEPKADRTGEILFLDESWFQLEVDGSACVGTLLAHPQGTTAAAVRLPRIGEVLYQGLPLAGVTMADGSLVIVPSPVSGVVVSVNEELADNPSPLFNDPCGSSWIACVCTTRLDEEVKNCQPRRVILTDSHEASAHEQSEKLASLGCQVRVVKDWEELAPLVDDPAFGLLVFNAASFGDRGPELIGQINQAAPLLRTVVVTSSESQWEAAYRAQKIFYYAVAPFDDNEIVEILNAAFRPQVQEPPRIEQNEGSSEPVSNIRITNRNGHKVQLVAAPGLLRRDEGLGGEIRHRLVDRMFPVSTTPGEADITPASILRTAGTCDRLMLLLAKETGRLPGSLIRDTKAEFGSESEGGTSRVTTLVVQPNSAKNDFSGLDVRTTAALAEHIVQEMASY